MSVAAVGCSGAPAGAGKAIGKLRKNLGGMSGWEWPAGAAAGGAGRTRFASDFGLSVIVPAGPLSETSCGEMLSIRQSFSASPSDRTTALVPFTAKIAMRRSGSITMPLSLTSGGPRSLLLSDDAVCEARCVGPCSGSAISRACAPVLISVAGGPRESESEPLTLGQALAVGVRLIVWCKTCGDPAEPGIATQVAHHGSGMPLIDWR